MSHDRGDSGLAEQEAGEGHVHAPRQPIGWMDKPDFVKRLFLVLYVIAGLLILAEMVFGRTTEHPHPYEGPFGFYAVYGFISFWFLVLLAKPMRTLLIRSEDYYEPAKHAEDEPAPSEDKGDADAG